ncbi:putative candidate secreted effector protein [Blumeria hordei DH14]|uniref:Putative candidate secreted effector protein n=1 Tax=Blumeria graminis f. sp. hordei (strain DH14) TaxID=546991 RepID=N1JLH2_BLUG1|nr:putative candidate secreted effector protein [Blumeria hordei DH14]
MWINFSVTLAISWLILQVNCDDIPASDTYLPNGTNGFVCGLEFHSIDHVREVARRGVEAFFSKTRFGNFPTTFEDTQLFNVKSDILLSWPIVSNRKFYNRTPGKSRLIINTRGQIMGIVVIAFEKPSHKISYNKCMPVHRSLEENNEEQTLLNERWGLANPTFGYNCDSKFFPKSIVDKIIGPDSSIFFKKRLSAKHKLPSLQKYTGDEFSGVDLYWFPMHRKLTYKCSTGICIPHHRIRLCRRRFRVVFDLSNGEFKGIIDVEERNKKCVTVWDLSSISSNNIYISSSTLNLDKFRDSYWPKSCFGYKLKSKIIWLYIEFALKNWMPTLNGSNPNLPFETQDLKDFLLLRPEETNNDSSHHVFAIDHNKQLDTYNLYHITKRNFSVNILKPCLEFSSDDIRRLQKHIGNKHNPEESLSLDR